MKWKTIPSHQDYEISEMGDVRRLTSVKAVGRYIPKGYIISSFVSNQGYKRVYLSKNKKQKKYSIHRLVLTAFVGKCPSEKHQCCHNDGNKKNNHVGNLRWDTASNNQKDRLKHGTDLRGEKQPRSVLTEKIVKAMWNYWNKNKISKRDVAKLFNINENTVYHVLCGHTWRHITGYKNADDK